MNPAVESEFLQLLPSLLRDGLDGAGVDGGGSLLSKLLLVAQKFLTGVDDDVPNPKRGQSVGDEPIETTIDRIDRLFDPWRAPPEFLPWLASWVNLELREEWSTIQRRKLIAEMVPFARKTGLKVGLHRYLDLYAAREYRPRISIDDGEAVFRLAFGKDGSPRLTTIAFSHLATTPDTRWPILAHPSAVAVLRPDHPNSPGLRYIVAEPGTNLGDDYGKFQTSIRQAREEIDEPRPGAIWCLLPNGELDPCHFSVVADSASGPAIRPLNHGDGENEGPLLNPVAMAIDDRDGSLLVLDQGHQFGSVSIPARIYRYHLALKPDGTASVAVPSVPVKREAVCTDLKVGANSRAVALVLVPGRGGPQNRRIVVLESNPSMVGNSVPALSVIDAYETNQVFGAADEKTVRRIVLQNVINPTAIAHEEGDAFLLTDCREDEVAVTGELHADVTASDVRNLLAGQLVRITIPDSGTTAAGTSLLTVEAWPAPCLIYPTGLVCIGRRRFLVCDTGVKQHVGKMRLPSTFVRSVVEPAMLHVIDLGEPAPHPVPLVARSGLTRPSGMTCGPSDEVIIIDRGETAEAIGGTELGLRCSAYTMKISILYSSDRFPLPRDKDAASAQERLIAYERLQSSIQGVQALIEREKPAHIRSVWE
ncbi:MAG: phage tail protein [Isosphaeraceae bacterium]